MTHLTRRADLIREQLAHLPHQQHDGAAAAPVRAGATGSGADLLVLTWTAADLARERAAGARLLRSIGVARGMRVANTLPGALAVPGSLLLGDVVEDVGALDVPLGAIESDTAARQAWELMDRVQPEVMILESTTAARFFAAAPDAVRGWWKGLVWLRRGAVALPPPPVPTAAGFTGWQRIWFAVAEVTSFVAHSCSESRFHLEASVNAEIVDGTLVLSLADGDIPLRRYASGIVARRASDPCPCGMSGAILELD
jgi:hypothetical protein